MKFKVNFTLNYHIKALFLVHFIPTLIHVGVFSAELVRSVRLKTIILPADQVSS